MERIYVDHAATTPLHPQVLKKVHAYLRDSFGNPSSIHYFGRKSRAVLDESRERLAARLRVKGSQLVFTSGGTEADNLAVIGSALANKEKGKHIITSQIEHYAILNSCHFLESLGFEVTYLPVNHLGQVDISKLEEHLREDTILVSIMYANNEVGTLQPIQEIGHLLKERGILFHTDAVQALGVTPLDLSKLPVDLLSLSSHKINGPQGIGCLYVGEQVRLKPIIHGGAQERNRRAGTENIAGVLGFVEAVEIAYSEMERNLSLYQSFKERLLSILQREEIDFQVNGDPDRSLAHILNISFMGVPAEIMLMNLDMEGIAASSGSACTAGTLQPSHVLQAMYPEGDERINSAIRFSFGYGNTLEQIEQVAQIIVKLVKRLKG